MSAGIRTRPPDRRSGPLEPGPPNQSGERPRASRAHQKSGQSPASWSIASVLIGAVFALAATGCASGKRWVQKPLVSAEKSEGLRLYDPHARTTPHSELAPSGVARAGAGGGSAKDAGRPSRPGEDDATPQETDRPHLRLSGTPARRTGKNKGAPDVPETGTLLGVFRNTYYDFPAEFNYGFDGGARSIIHDRDCSAIAEVPAGFFGALCVQGSGTLATGETVSFSRRDCSCAEVCPRTGQQICFDRLDQSEFPWGRGALGTAIIPLSTIAVDSSVIPLGTVVYIAEYDGVERHPGGNPHDGCFVAQDRGMKVVGKHVDVFTGNPSVTEHWNRMVPSNEGVHVYTGTLRCSEPTASRSSPSP